MRRSYAIFFAFLFLMPVIAQDQPKEKRPFTFEDMMKLKRVAEPEVSPDGKWVIFSVVDVDLTANTKTPHIWIVPVAGGEEREIIAEQDADRPRWAPDGKRFAFLSTKEGGSQVWIADFDGVAGTVNFTYKETSIATEASGELWSPDGKNILFMSDVYPDCEFDDRGEYFCNNAKQTEVEKSKVKAQILTHLLYRHWNAYKEGKRSHIFVVSAVSQNGPNARDQLRPIPRDLTPGDFDAPVFSLGGQDNYAFSPDGQEICYTSNHDKNPAASTNNDLWLVSVNGGEAKNITADNPASDSTPLYSPDGKYIAYRAQQRPGYEADRFRLMLYDRKTGEKKNLTEDFDRWVGTYVWSLDSSEIFFTAENEGEQPIFVLDMGTRKYSARDYGKCEFCSGAIRMLPAVGGYNDDLTVARDKSLIYTKMTIMTPNIITRTRLAAHMCDLVSANPSQNNSDLGNCGDSRFDLQFPIESINHEIFSQTERQDLQSFWFTGAHGDKVQGFLVMPPNFNPDKKYPLKFIIHGGPEVPMGDEWSYRWSAELFASPTASTSSGYVVIMINFHGSPGYGQAFIDAINGDWGGAPYEDLMKGLDYAEEHYGFIDKDRECALGASYGGYMINWIEGHTARFKCLVSHDGMFNAESTWGSTEEVWFNNWEFKGAPYDNRASYEKWSPHQYAKNFKTPMLVVHSQKDYRLDVSEGFQLFTTLQMQGVPSKMLYFPDEGHWVLKPQNSQLWYKTVDDWVDQWIGK